MLLLRLSLRWAREEEGDNLEEARDLIAYVWVEGVGCECFGCVGAWVRGCVDAWMRGWERMGLGRGGYGVPGDGESRWLEWEVFAGECLVIACLKQRSRGQETNMCNAGASLLFSTGA